mgnify:FL=1
MIDGLHGDANWRKGRWQGYQGQDFECVIDMGNQQEISSFNTGFLQDTRAWILMPVSVEYLISDDGKLFNNVGIVQHQTAPDNYEISIENFKLQTEAPIKARYIKVVAKNFGKLPSWHQGFSMGGEAFIFVDEVEVE